MKKLMAVLALGAGLASPAYADFVVTGPVVDTTTVLNDNFQTGLINAGYSKFQQGGSLDVTPGTYIITFEAKGAESSYLNTLWMGGIDIFDDTSSSALPIIYNGGDQTTAASNMFKKPGEFAGTFIGITVGDLLSGGSDALKFTSNIGVTATNGAGDAGWGVFFNPNDLSSVILAYDDGGPGDHNHDDLRVKATIQLVPEPATWSLMIAGFAFLGWMQRRRTVAARA